MLICLSLFWLAYNLYANIKFLVNHGTHPILELTSKLFGDVTIDLIEWGMFDVDSVCFTIINSLRFIVNGWSLSYLIQPHVLCLMTKQSKEVNHREFNRLWNHYLRINVTLTISYSDRCYMLNECMTRAEHTQKVERVGSHCYNFSDVHESHTRNLSYYHMAFIAPQ